MEVKKIHVWISLFVLILSAAGGTLSAERVNTIGVNAGIIASVDDRPYVEGYTPASSSDEYFFVGSFFPQVTLASRGPASLFSLNYTFGMDKVSSDQNLDSKSHAVGLEWNASLGPKSTFRLSNNFRMTPDFDSFNLFRGIVETPDGYFFDFDTVALHRDSYWNSTSAEIGVRVGENSSLIFSGGYSFKNYENTEGFRNENQVRTDAGIKLSRDISEKTSWNTEYDFRYWEYYGGASSAYGHNLGFGLTHKFTPTLSLNLSAGPAYVVYTGSNESFDNKTGYNVELSLRKRIEKHLFNISYSERSAATFGGGSLTKTRDAGLEYSREFQWVMVNGSIRYFNIESLYETDYSPEGVFTTLSLGFKATRNLIFEVGGSYRKQEDDKVSAYSLYGDY